MLRTLILALHHNSGRKMRDTDSRRRLVDMLSSGTTGAERINTDIFLPDLHIDIFFYIRHHIAGYKRSLSFSGCVKRRNTNQPVHTFFRFQISIRILPIHLKCNGFDSGLFSIQRIQHFHGKSLFICPSGIHTIEHGCPVTGFRATRSRMQGNNGVVPVIFSRQKRFHTDILIGLNKFFHHLIDLRDQFRIIFLISHLDHGFNIIILRRQCRISCHIVL